MAEETDVPDAFELDRERAAAGGELRRSIMVIVFGVSARGSVSDISMRLEDMVGSPGVSIAGLVNGVGCGLHGGALGSRGRRDGRLPIAFVWVHCSWGVTRTWLREQKQ